MIFALISRLEALYESNRAELNRSVMDTREEARLKGRQSGLLSALNLARELRDVQ